jgi:hypothetical protein
VGLSGPRLGGPGYRVSRRPSVWVEQPARPLVGYFVQLIYAYKCP